MITQLTAIVRYSLLGIFIISLLVTSSCAVDSQSPSPEHEITQIATTPFPEKEVVASTRPTLATTTPPITASVFPENEVVASAPLTLTVTAVSSVTLTEAAESPIISATFTSEPISSTPTVLPTLSQVNYIGELAFGGYHLAISPNGKLLATALLSDTGDFIYLIDLATGDIRWTFEKPESPVNGTRSLAFSSDNVFLAVGGAEQTVFILNVSNGELISELPFWSVVYQLSFSPDNQLLAACTPGEIAGIGVWNLDTGNQNALLQDVPALDIDFAPDADVLAVALNYPYPEVSPNGVVLLWNTRDGSTETIFSGQSAQGVAFSPDGQILAAIVDGHLRLTNLHSKSEIEVEESEFGLGLARIVFSSEGYIATVNPINRDGNITIWDLEGQLITHIQSEGTSDIAFTTDGLKLFSARPGKNIEVWELPAR